MLRKRSIATKKNNFAVDRRCAQGALPERRASACARTSLLLPATTSKAAQGQTGTGSDKIWLKLLARRLLTRDFAIGLAYASRPPASMAVLSTMAALSRLRARPVAAMAVLSTKSGQMARSLTFGLRLADFILSRVRSLSAARPSYF